MKNLLFFSLTLLLSSFATAKTCLPPNLMSFAAYAIEDMDVRESDHQGLSGAGGNLTARHFLFEGNPEVCQSLFAGGELRLTDGSTHSGVEGWSVRLERAAVKSGFVDGVASVSVKNASGQRRKLSGLSVDHRSFARELEEGSRDMFQWADNASFEKSGQGLVARLGKGSTVLSLTMDDLRLSRRLVLEGSPESWVVINIRDRHVVLDGLEVVLSGGVSPDRIRWNLYETESLVISRTHDPVYGLPGTVLAPCAETEFYDGLLTGRLLVRSIKFDERKGFRHSGQINRYVPRPSCRCSRN